MVKTHGLSHVALSVVDPDRSLAFYRSVFGVREYFRSESTIQVLGPGPHDVLAFEKRPADAGVSGGIIHFGFRLTRRKTSMPQSRRWRVPGASSRLAASSPRVYPTPSFAIPTAMKLKYGLSERIEPSRSIQRQGGQPWLR